ncbi:hypothetical protein ScPMuIL_015794 [Solemya velum]
MAVTDGVRVVTQPPLTDTAVVQVLPVSLTQYPVTDQYQSDVTQLRLTWLGFQDPAGIDSYQVVVDGPGLQLRRRVPSYNDIRNFMSISNLQLIEGSYNISVTAINLLKKQSKPVSTDVIIVTKKPTVNANRTIEYNWDKSMRSLTLTWEAIFKSAHPVYYEVSVGNLQGAADVVQWQETKATRMTFSVPRPSYADTKQIVVTVRSINPGGCFSDATVEAFLTF